MIQKFIIENDKSLPQGIIAIKTTERGAPKVIVPVKYQKPLAQRTHLELLHQRTNGMHHQLSKYYYWPNMRATIAEVYNECRHCKRAQVRRRQLISEFEQRFFKDLASPRQSHGIDFYGIGGKQFGYILVIVDLCTREVILRHCKNRE